MTGRSTKWMLCGTFACSLWISGTVGAGPARAQSSTAPSQPVLCSDMTHVAEADAVLLRDTTEQHVQQLGADLKLVAAAVPPPAIAPHRVQLVHLIATNLLGQNTPVIAATETQYEEMWAQDAAAMYGYAAASSLSGVPARLDPVARYVEHVCPNSGNALKGLVGSEDLRPMPGPAP